MGAWGEGLAARHLQARGWTILDRNYRNARKEIDLVARRGEVVAFVEVKARTGLAMGHPAEALGDAKRDAIARVAASWIAEKGCPALTYRFDVICILRNPRGQVRLEHLEDAWGV